MKVMLKNIVYKSVGVLLSMAMLCGCAAQGNNGAIGGDDGISASSISASNASVSSTEVSVSLLSEDVTEESVNKVKDAWRRLSEIVPITDTEFAIGPATEHVKRDGRVNFTEKEISDDNFNEIFTDKCTDLAYWKTVGLTEYAFGYTPSNTENQVKEYLDKREEKTLPLFALYFFEEFSEESDLQMSRDCAYYLTRYALDKYSFNDFSVNDHRGEWLADLGSTGNFRFDEIDELVEAATAVKSQTGATVKCAGNIWDITEVEWLKSVDDVYCLLYEAEEGIQNLCKRIAAESDIYTEESFRKSVQITLTDKGELSTYQDGVIRLLHPITFVHEYIHHTLNYSFKEGWIAEGLAVYYSRDYEEAYVRGHNMFGDSFQKWYEEGIIDDESMAKMEQDGAAEYELTIVDYYQKLREKDKDQNNQYTCYEYANGLTDLSFFGTETRENLKYIKTIRDVYDIAGSMEKMDDLGFDLTYQAAMVITEDLIANYGLDSLVESSGSFEEDFGMTSDEYIQNYVDNKLYMHFLEE